MGIYTDYNNAVSDKRQLESELEEVQTLIDLLEPHNRNMELWDVPDEDEQIEDLGGDLDDTVGEALKKANDLFAELECELDEIESAIRTYEGKLGIV